MRKAKVWDARQLPAYLTVAQYGELMGICPKTVRRMCQRGAARPQGGAEAVAHRQERCAGARQETMELCQQNARKAPKNKKPAGAGTPTSFRVTG